MRLSSWVMVLAACGCAAAPAPPAASPARPKSSTEAALESLTARPGWLFPFAACPADVFPGTAVPVTYLDEACAPDLQSCLDRCRASDANACYAAALRTQRMKTPADFWAALFLRACRLGVASGCTNRAAGMVVDETDDPVVWRCASRTFESMCDLNDPWACAMWGSSLLRGRGVDRDLARARAVLSKACLRGEDDPACAAGRIVLEQVKAAAGGAEIP